MTEDNEDELNNEITENEAEDIRVIQHNNNNTKFAQKTQSVNNETEIPHLDVPINEEIDDGNMLENIETIKENEQMDKNKIMEENYDLIEIDVNEKEQPINF
jgi:hypothetical protein